MLREFQKNPEPQGTPSTRSSQATIKSRVSPEFPSTDPADPAPVLRKFQIPATKTIHWTVIKTLLYPHRDLAAGRQGFGVNGLKAESEVNRMRNELGWLSVGQNRGCLRRLALACLTL